MKVDFIVDGITDNFYSSGRILWIKHGLSFMWVTITHRQASGDSPFTG